MIEKYLYSNLYMFISVFNYVCLNGRHPPEMQGCCHEGRLVKLLTFFFLPGTKFDQSFLGSSICFLLQNSRFVVQHMHHCVCKMQMATTGRQPVGFVFKNL